MLRLCNLSNSSWIGRRIFSGVKVGNADCKRGVGVLLKITMALIVAILLAWLESSLRRAASALLHPGVVSRVPRLALRFCTAQTPATRGAGTEVIIPHAKTISMHLKPQGKSDRWP